jgi:two-component system chemotaxis sensor kinase CheA
MERFLFRQIWPVFSAEAREHLSSIGSGVLDLERDPSQAGVLDRVRRIAHSLKGSAASLGLGDLERLSHAIESSLAGFDPAAGLSRGLVQAVLNAVTAIEGAVEAGDAGEEPRLPALAALLEELGVTPAAPRSGTAAASPPPQPPATPPPATLETLEEALARLCTPLEPEERARAAEEAARGAQALGARLPAQAALAGRIAEGFRRLAAGGDEAARGAAALAGELIGLREATEAGPAHAAAGPAPAQGEAASERSIRVLASALDSLARQLELLALAEGRHARRARELLAGEAALREATGRVEEAATALRSNGVDVGKGALDEGVARLRAVAVDVARLAREGRRESEGQRLAAAVLREDLRALRMVPAAALLDPVRRVAREVAGRRGREVEVVLLGEDVKLDRRVVDLLRDPLIHLVRNAVDHGIEEPALRVAAGKPATGRLTVKVEPRGGRVGVLVEDDGRGLDPAAIRASAVQKGLVSAEAAAQLPDDDAVRLIFQAGLSTARAVTELSGRGVGLDVVREALTRLQGSVEVRFEKGRFTRFDLEVPLTLAATAALLFRVGRDAAALPAETVERVLLHGEPELGTVAGRVMLKVGGEQLPYAHLGRLIGSGAPPVAPGRRVALVLRHGGQRAALGVEEILGQQEVVVSTLGARVASVAHLAGAAMLDDGRVVGVLAAPELLRRAQPAAAPRAAAARVRVLVADDALTTRSAMKALLEIAGYAVVTAGDGEEGLALLRESGAQLVVTDVQMPRLDGLGFCRAVKADPALRQIPVVLVTSLDAPEDRAAGLEAGADGYVVKREVERGKLLELVRQLLPARA